MPPRWLLPGVISLRAALNASFPDRSVFRPRGVACVSPHGLAQLLMGCGECMCITPGNPLRCEQPAVAAGEQHGSGLSGWRAPQGAVLANLLPAVKKTDIGTT